MFLVNVPIGIVAIAYGMRLLRESRDVKQERPDLLGSALIIVAVGVLALGLVKAPEWGWSRSPHARVVRHRGGRPGGLLGALPDPPLSGDRSGTPARALVHARPTPRRCFFSAGFAAFLLANVLFMTRSGTSRCCAPESC